MNSFDILRRPIVTEKSTLLQEQGRYAFEVAVRATKLGAVDFIEKPFSIEGLLASVNQALNKETGTGQGAGLLDEVKPARQIMEEWANECLEAFEERGMLS